VQLPPLPLLHARRRRTAAGPVSVMRPASSHETRPARAAVRRQCRAQPIVRVRAPDIVGQEPSQKGRIQHAAL
jgi:hypothetical protein